MKQAKLSQEAMTGKMIITEQSEDSETSEAETDRDFHSRRSLDRKNLNWSTNLISSRDPVSCPIVLKARELQELHAKYGNINPFGDGQGQGILFFDPMKIGIKGRTSALSNRALDPDEVQRFVSKAIGLLSQGQGAACLQQNTPGSANTGMQLEHLIPQSAMHQRITAQQTPSYPSRHISASSKRIFKARARSERLAQKQHETENAILRLHKDERLSIKQISSRFNVTKYKVMSVLASTNRKGAPKNAFNRGRIKFSMITQDIKSSIQAYVKDSLSLITGKDIQQFLLKNHKVKISKTHLLRYLKESLGLSYKKYGLVTPNQNSTQCKVQRQNAARHLVMLTEQHKVIINVDESAFANSDNRSRGWGLIGEPTKTVFRQRLPSTNVIAAVTSRGDVFFTLNQGKTNSVTFVLFLEKLISYLDSKLEGWRNDHVIMVDNAPYHRSRLTQSFIKEHQIPLMYLGPYNFHMAPVEKLFSVMKSRDLNPNRIRVTSRNFYSMFLAECGKLLRSLDYSWVSRSFLKALEAAIDCLQLRDI